VSYVIKTFVAMALFAFCWVAVGYGINQMLQVGTCASGGPYVVARECPDGVGGLIFALIGGILGMFVAAGIYLSRGKPPGGAPAPNNAGIVIWFWTGLFWALAVGALLGVWGPDANPGPGGKTGGLIVGFMGVVMGAGGLLALKFPEVRGGRKSGGDMAAMMRTAGPAMKLGESMGVSGASNDASDGFFERSAQTGDPVERLKALDQLRRSGAITQSEFETLKAKILSGES